MLKPAPGRSMAAGRFGLFHSSPARLEPLLGRMGSGYRLSAPILGRVAACQSGWACKDSQGAKLSPGCGDKPILTRRHPSAWVAALTCASLLAISLAADPAAARTAKHSGGKSSASKSTHETSAKSSG